jgi:hypothetical protein
MLKYPKLPKTLEEVIYLYSQQNDARVLACALHIVVNLIKQHRRHKVSTDLPSPLDGMDQRLISSISAFLIQISTKVRLPFLN